MTSYLGLTCGKLLAVEGLYAVSRPFREMHPPIAFCGRLQGRACVEACSAPVKGNGFWKRLLPAETGYTSELKDRLV